MRWRVLLDTKRAGNGPMAVDEALAHDAVPTVRLFLWDPAGISLGRGQDRPVWVDGDAWSDGSLVVARRPTGGGLALHGSDVSVSVVVPRNCERLAALMPAVCSSAVRLCRSFGAPAVGVLAGASNGRITYCLAESSPYAVLAGGRKLAGFAIRRYPESWLIQGSLLVHTIPPVLGVVLPPDVHGALARRATTLSAQSTDVVTEQLVLERWAASWAAWWIDALTEGAARVACTDDAVTMVARDGTRGEHAV